MVGTKTLRGLVAESELVLRARIASDGEPLAASGAARPTLDAEVLELLKGKLDARRVRFAQHGHGVALFEPGEETLLFLVPIERSRELDELGVAGGPAWVSLQEHADEYPIDGASRERLLGAVRSYVEAEAAGSADARLSALQRGTLTLLTSRDARLASSAIRDLVQAPQAPLVRSEDLPELLAVLDEPQGSIGVRIALLTELDRRGLVDGSGIWLRLLSAETPERDRVVAIRAAGASGGAPVRSRLLALALDPDAEIAAAALDALARPGADDAVAPLASALSREPARVRIAAIRGLGRIGTPEALRALDQAASSHPDPATRRRAGAEIRKRGGGPAR